MATFLVAHGAWSAGWAWKKMRPLLRDALDDPVPFWSAICRASRTEVEGCECENRASFEALHETPDRGLQPRVGMATRGDAEVCIDCQSLAMKFY